MLRKILVTASLILLWALIVAALMFVEANWFGEPPVERGNLASIENYLIGKMRGAAEEERLGSAALALMQNGEIVSKHGFGVSNAETQTPVNPDRTLFQLASVSKAVTAFGVMKLVEENKIGLDEPAMHHLKRWRFPGSEAHRNKITIRHLLTHTAALYDGVRFGAVEPGEKMPTLEESLNAAGSDELKIINEPGTAFVYGNGNYAVLQLLIEDVTGKPFAEYMRETVLQPLGMNESSFDAESVAQNIAPDFDSSLTVHPRRRYTAAAAVALYSSATDVARFARAFTGENPVLKPETIKQMLAPQNGTNGTWGLGQTLYVENGAGGFIVGHDGGAIPAWGAAMRFNPATGNGFVLLISGGSGATNRLTHDWIYWETGKMTAQGKRQFFYDRMKGLGLAALIFGTLVISLWRVFGAKFRRRENNSMKSFIFIAILIFTACFSAQAQNAKSSDAKDASAVPDKLFEAMRAKNFEEIRAAFTPAGQLVAIDKPRDGKGISKTRIFTAESFAKMISEAKGGEFIEKMPDKNVLIDGDLAIVSGRYTFYVGDKFSHCGLNTFNLVRTETGWKIANAASTLELQCERDLKAIEIQIVEADPRDVSTIDGIIKAFYETISGGKNVPRQWSRDRTLYTPGIRFVAMSERDGKIRANVMNHNQYVNSSNDFFVAEGFTEREINRVVRRFGNIAHVFSTYEFWTEGKKEKTRGVNSIELFWDGKRWWISAVSWDEERAGNPIPKEFLNNKK